ncbi:MAG: J domain-containing protein [Pseudomonadota bacterium]
MAEKIHTHYDNLKVIRTAPLEVIKAAYKAMAQKHHPDRNPSKDSERVMKLVNEAWDVLSDPRRRAEHDQWIAEQEAMQKANVYAAQRPKDTSSPDGGTRSNSHRHESMRPRRQQDRETEATRRDSTDSASASTVHREGKNGTGTRTMLIVLVGLIMFIVYRANQGGTNSSPTEVNAPLSLDTSQAVTKPLLAPTTVQNPTAPVYPTQAPVDPYTASRERRALLEYGQRLPPSSGPVIGSMQENSAGRSTITIDNSQNDSDVVLKLCDGNWTHCLPARHVYIARGDRFTMRSISAGSYDVRYVSLESGSLSKSQSFELEAIETPQGTQVSNVTMTLYTVRDGNTRMTRIGADQF